MSRNVKRRNIGMALVPAILVVASGLGFAAQSTSSVQTASTAVHQANVSSGVRSGSSSGVVSKVESGSVLANGVRVVADSRHDVSPALGSLQPTGPLGTRPAEHELNTRRGSVGGKSVDVDPVIQKQFGPFAMPTPILNFPGIQFSTGGTGWPPDTTGDVGPDNYVQFVNGSIQIWNKQGVSLRGPVPGNSLWAGFGGACQAQNDGDPIVQYDQLAHRWLLTQFALPNYPNGPFYQCIALSTTPDPLGTYYRYSFQTSATLLNDYPHFGVWPDGYYMTANLFHSDQSWAGTGMYAFDRAAMLTGGAATLLIHELPSTDWGGMMPSDLEGSNLPPAGAPNYFVEVNDAAWDPPNTPADELQVYRFHADFQNPGNTTITGPTRLAVAPFDGIACPNFATGCVPQLGTTSKLDAITDRLMYRLSYRNFGDHEALVVNHTVDAGPNDTGHTGVRWYELRNISTTPTIYQQGTYAPDANSRWMGSAAMDAQGNLAIGFSISSASMYPSIAYAGRLATDPLGDLTQGEATLFAGTGAQTSGGGSRWGDYSTLSVDPSDDCTFWYTQEYYATTGTNWQTRIGTFKFPSCGSGSGTPTPTSTSVPATATATSTSVAATATATSTSVAGTATATNTAVASTATSTATAVAPTATATPCSIGFTDVHPTDYFYEPVRYLSCNGVISGYADNTFRPSANVTRSQLTKIIVLAEGWAINTTGGPHFTDVPTSNPFYAFVETAYNRGVISGYTDGTFRPFVDVTRGQISKIVVSAEGWAINTTGGPHFTDVPTSNPFYGFIETAYNHSVISGYSDNTFRWGNNATRGQVSKIVYVAVTQP